MDRDKEISMNYQDALNMQKRFEQSVVEGDWVLVEDGRGWQAVVHRNVAQGLVDQFPSTLYTVTPVKIFRVG
jgi:hypothetical protein